MFAKNYQNTWFDKVVAKINFAVFFTHMVYVYFLI